MSNHPVILGDLESGVAPPNGLPTHEVPLEATPYEDEKKDSHLGNGDGAVTVSAATAFGHDESLPTDEEMKGLRKVPAPMTWMCIAMCAIEFAERASYYGSSGPFNNFINNPLPAGGSGTGAVAKGDAGLNESAGALGLGSVDASALTNLFTFLAYVIPIFGRSQIRSLVRQRDADY